MFERKDLEELEKLHFDDAFVVSLFLNVSPQERKKQAYLSKFKNLLKNKTDYNACKEDIDKIESFLQGERESFKKSVVVYSCVKKDLWVRYDLNAELNDDLVIDKTPYTSPLFDLLDNYQKYGVLLVDKKTARVFLVFWVILKNMVLFIMKMYPENIKKVAGLLLQRKDMKDTLIIM